MRTWYLLIIRIKAIVASIILFYTLAFSQGAVQLVTLQEADTIFRVSIFSEDFVIRHHNHLTYHSYFKDRIIRTQGQHHGRLLNGDYRKMTKQAQLLEQGNYQKGLRDGEWKYWYLSGNLQEVEEWKDGQLHGSFAKYTEDGQLMEKGTYRKGELHGKRYVFPTNGEPIIEQYVNGELKPKKEKEVKPKKNKEEPGAKKKAIKLTSHTRRRQSLESVKKDGEERVAENPKSYIDLFVLDAASQKPIVQASVKINKLQGDAQEAIFQRFAYTDKEGHIRLQRDSSDFSLQINAAGYGLHDARIYMQDERETFLFRLEKTERCGNMVGVIQKGNLKIPLANAQVKISDANGKLITQTYTDAQGNFTYCLPCGSLYNIVAQKKGYQIRQESYFMPADCQGKAHQIKVYALVEVASQPPIAQERVENTRANNLDLPVYTPSTDENKAGSGKDEDISSISSLGTYTVIAGTFSKRTNATKQLEAIQQAGFTKAQIIQLPDNRLFAVSLGGFSNREPAEKLLSRFTTVTAFRAYIRGPRP